MNNFLSTTTDRYIARIFAGDGNTNNSDCDVSVLYEITVDTRLSHSVLFVELVGRSNFEDENEVLFSMGAVFRIEETYQEHKYLWTVKLTLTTDEDDQWNVLTEHLQSRDYIIKQMSREISIVANENDENVVSKCTNNRRERRSRSFDNYRYSKRDFRRSYWPEAFRLTMTRRFEHPAYQNVYKEL